MYPYCKVKLLRSIKSHCLAFLCFKALQCWKRVQNWTWTTSESAWVYGVFISALTPGFGTLTVSSLPAFANVSLSAISEHNGSVSVWLALNLQSSPIVDSSHDCNWIRFCLKHVIVEEKQSTYIFKHFKDDTVFAVQTPPRVWRAMNEGTDRS